MNAIRKLARDASNHRAHMVDVAIARAYTHPPRPHRDDSIARSARAFRRTLLAGIGLDDAEFKSLQRGRKV